MLVKLSSFAHTPLWLWPNILSLDAPVIAALWQHLFATAANAPLSWASRLALPLAVWLIYLLDRLLDTGGGAAPRPTARHCFYRLHRKLAFCLAACAGVALIILTCFLPMTVRMSGLAVSLLVVLYLLAIHHWHLPGLPKEAMVSLIFAIGTALAPAARASAAWRVVFPALLFSLLCWINCSAIEAWESGETRWAERHMKALAGVIALSCLPLSLWLPPYNHCAVALFVAAVGLWQIGRRRLSVEKEALRVWTDVPLLAPLLLMGLR